MPSSSTSTPTPTTGFLSFNSSPPRLIITSPLPTPEKTLATWQAAGFSTQYIPYDASTPQSQQAYAHTLRHLHETVDFGQKYALLAYGDAASVALAVAAKPMPRCCALVAFYPGVLPKPRHLFPSQLRVQVHVAGRSQVSPPPERCAWKQYRYEGCARGFAEPGDEAFEAVEAELAGSRALAAVRSGFGLEADGGVEAVAERAVRARYWDHGGDAERGAVGVVQDMTQDSAHVTMVPTLSGGVGRKRLREFYAEFFVPSLVEDFDLRLVSRTVGVDRVVDEMVVSFTHSDEVDWILPGVPATGRFVEVAVVSVVAVKGGKLVSEHMYWDQASVLVQAGLLDPKAVPQKMKKGGLKQLPVVGAEAAKQLIDPQQQRYNGLLKLHGLTEGIGGTNGVAS